MIHQAFDERMREPLLDRSVAPHLLVNRLLALLFDRLRKRDQPLGGVGPPVQEHVLHQLEQVLGNFLIHRQLPGVHDAHVQTGPYGMVEKGGMHRLAHGVVPAERERNIADPSADLAVREGGFDPPRGLNEIDRVVVMLLDARGHGQHIGIENYVLRREADLPGQDPVGAPADLHLAFQGVGLTRFVKGHDHDRSPVPLDQPGIVCERLLALFQTDRVHHGFALHALEARLDHRPLGAVDHDWHAGDIRLRGDQAQELHHRLFRIQHGFVQVDIDELRAAHDLLPRDGQGGLVLAAQYQLGEHGGAGDVGPFPDVDEIGFRANRQRLQAAQPCVRFGASRHPRLAVPDGVRDRCDVGRRGPTAPPHEVEPAVRRKFPEVLGHDLRRLIEPAERIGQPGVGVTTDGHRGNL